MKHYTRLLCIVYLPIVENQFLTLYLLHRLSCLVNAIFSQHGEKSFMQKIITNQLFSVLNKNENCCEIKKYT